MLYVMPSQAADSDTSQGIKVTAPHSEAAKKTWPFLWRSPMVSLACLSELFSRLQLFWVLGRTICHILCLLILDQFFSEWACNASSGSSCMIALTLDTVWLLVPGGYLANRMVGKIGEPLFDGVGDSGEPNSNDSGRKSIGWGPDGKE